jgi:hypothetical protein
MTLDFDKKTGIKQGNPWAGMMLNSRLTLV